jgi:hypothetical protein
VSTVKIDLIFNRGQGDPDPAQGQNGSAVLRPSAALLLASGYVVTPNILDCEAANNAEIVLSTAKGAGSGTAVLFIAQTADDIVTPRWYPSSKVDLNTSIVARFEGKMSGDTIYAALGENGLPFVVSFRRRYLRLWVKAEGGDYDGVAAVVRPVWTP